MKPLKRLGIIPESQIRDIFSNLEDIVYFHQDISTSLYEIQKSNTGILKLEKVIAIYEMNLEEFFLYQIYCGNQNTSVRTLKSLSGNEDFSEFLHVNWSILISLEV